MFVDIGSHFGLCIRDADTIYKVWGVNAKKVVLHGERFSMFHAAVDKSFKDYPLKVCAYEFAHHQPGVGQEVFTGMLGILKMVCFNNGIKTFAIATPICKKFGVGKNTSDKEVVMRVVNARWKHSLKEEITDDNAADSVTVGDAFYGMLETNPFALKSTR